MVGLAKHYLDVVNDNGEKKNLLKRMRARAKEVSGVAYDAEDFSEPLSSELYNPNRQSGESNRSGHDWSNQASGTEASNVLQGCESPTTIKKSVLAPMGSLDAVDVETSKKVYRLIAQAFRKNKSLLTIGSCGSVYLIHWNSISAAIKLWNKVSQNGLEELRNEIQIYKALSERYPSVLRSAVPELLLTIPRPCRGSVYEGEAVLITSYVGRGLLQDRRGQLWVDDDGEFEAVDPDEASGICAAAILSLEALHEHNIFHGDIALRNLRVERSRCSSCPWHAW